MIIDILKLIQAMSRNFTVADFQVTGDSTFADTDVSGVLTVTNTTQSTDTKTGAAIISGGVGIAKNLNVGGNIDAVGNLGADGNLQVDGKAGITLDATVGGSATISGTTSTLAVAVIGGDGNKVTLTAPAVVTAYSMALPAAVGTVGQILMMSAGNQLIWGSTGGYDQDLNTTNDVEFKSVTSAGFIVDGLGTLRMYNDAGTFYFQQRAASVMAANYGIRYPATIGTAGQVLSLNTVVGTEATLSWATTTTYDQLLNTTNDVKFNSVEATQGVTIGGGFTLDLTTDDKKNTTSLKGAAVGAADYTLRFPAPAPAVNQMLKSDAAGVLSWIDGPVGGLGTSSDVDFKTVGAIDSVTIGPTAGLTGGVLAIVTGDSKVVSFTGPTVGAAFNLTLPTAAPAVNQMLKSDAAGQLSWIDGQTGGMGSTSAVTFNYATALTGLETQGGNPVSLGDATGHYIDLQAPLPTANYSLTFPAVAPALNQMLKSNGAGVFSWIDGPTAGMGTTSSVTFDYVTAISGLETQNGFPLALGDSTAHYVSLEASDPTATYTLTLPAVAPAVNQMLLSNGAGLFSWIAGQACGTSSNVTFNSVIATQGATIGAGFGVGLKTDDDKNTITIKGASAGTANYTVRYPTAAPSVATAAYQQLQTIADGTSTWVDKGNFSDIAFSKFSVDGAITATGNSQATAYALIKTMNNATVVAANTGVRLPVIIIGMRILVTNNGANALSVYPDATSGVDQIDALAANAAYPLAVGNTAEFIGMSANHWYVPLYV